MKTLQLFFLFEADFAFYLNCVTIRNGEKEFFCVVFPIQSYRHYFWRSLAFCIFSIDYTYN